ncbi:MAG: Rossmann-like and DUF2520 domain-containing protein [Anaerotardibacter sp.]
MKIGFIGAGKVGNTLGKYLSQSNEIVGYYSKSTKSAEEAAQFTASRAYDCPLSLVDDCDTIFITVPDGMIEPVWKELVTSQPERNWDGKNFCHCSGALPSSVFKEAADFGAFGYSVHPLFAVSSKTETWKELHKAFFAIEGSPEHLDEIVALVASQGNDYQVIKTDEKVRYHAAAAMASNHVVGLYKLACDELVKCGFTDEGAQKALVPLFLGNAEHIAHDGYVKALTGPAERGDNVTIAKHLSVLDGDTKTVYETINKTLLKIAEIKHAK